MSVDDVIARGSTSPLMEIETIARRRASDAGLDADTPDGQQHLRRLVDDVVREWSEDHRRGLRSHALADPRASRRGRTGTSPSTDR